MNEIGLATKKLATSQEQGISSSAAGELWEELRLEATQAATLEHICAAFLIRPCYARPILPRGWDRCWPESLGALHARRAA